MKTIAYSLIVAAGLATSSAMAADMAVKAPPPPAPAPSPWDVYTTGALMSDYNFRGITQSAHQPSTQAGFEFRYNFTPTLQGYAGISGESIDFPNRAAAEIDGYGGIRPTFDKLAFDFGYWYYWYPGGQCFDGAPFCGAQGAFLGGPMALPNTNVAKADASFYEFYGKVTFTVNDNVSLGFQEWYSPNVVNTGADGWFSTGNVTLTAPSSFTTWLPNGVGLSASGDVGYWALGTSDPFYGAGGFPLGIPYTSYWTWDVGVDFTWKVFTLDLRYYDTNLSRGDCNAYTSDQTAGFDGSFTPINPSGVGSNWCDGTFIAKLSVGFGLGALK